VYFFALDAHSSGALPAISDATEAVDLEKQIAESAGIGQDSVYLRAGTILVSQGLPAGDASEAVAVGDSGFVFSLGGRSEGTVGLKICTYTNAKAFEATVNVAMAWGQTYIFPIRIGEQITAVAVKIDSYSEAEFTELGDELQKQFIADLKNHQEVPAYDLYGGKAPASCSQ